MEEKKEITCDNLLKDAIKGDVNAKNDFVEKNIGLVWSIVKKFTNRDVEINDLFQIGCIGLIKAIDNFDITQDVQFSTYGVPMIVR